MGTNQDISFPPFPTGTTKISYFDELKDDLTGNKISQLKHMVTTVIWALSVKKKDKKLSTSKWKLYGETIYIMYPAN